MYKFDHNVAIVEVFFFTYITLALLNTSDSRLIPVPPELQVVRLDIREI